MTKFIFFYIITISQCHWSIVDLGDKLVETRHQLNFKQLFSSVDESLIQIQSIIKILNKVSLKITCGCQFG